MKILVIDNYDSFTYNLVQAVAVLGGDGEVVGDGVVEVKVFRNDLVSGQDLEKKEDCCGFSHLILSPGPCTPRSPRCSSSLPCTRWGSSGRKRPSRWSSAPISAPR